MAKKYFRARNWLKAVVLCPLRAYKRLISPVIPPACRYVPTCSEYAQEAIELHGVLKGGALAAWRLLRCHPLVTGGFDPVPRNGASEVHPHPSH